MHYPPLTSFFDIFSLDPSTKRFTNFNAAELLSSAKQLLEVYGGSILTSSMAIITLPYHRHGTLEQNKLVTMKE